MGETGPALRWWQSIPRYSLVFWWHSIPKHYQVFGWRSILKFYQVFGWWSITIKVAGGRVYSPKFHFLRPIESKAWVVGGPSCQSFTFALTGEAKIKVTGEKLQKMIFSKKQQNRGGISVYKLDWPVKTIFSLSVLLSGIFVVAGDETNAIFAQGFLLFFIDRQTFLLQRLV